MNKVTLVGRLGQDPEVKTSNLGKQYAKFSLATNDGYGENKKTNWHSCVAFGKVAELIDKYVSKGNELAVNGSVDYNKHDDKYYTNIIVNDITFIGGKSENSIQQAQQVVDNVMPPADNENDKLPF